MSDGINSHTGGFSVGFAGFLKTRYVFSRWHLDEQSSISYMSDHGQKRPVTGHLCDNGNAAKSLVMLVNWGTLFILSLRTKSQYFLWSLACSLFPANLSLILIA